MINWNNKLMSLTPEQFEGLCYDIIDSMNFTNLEWHKGGRDKGRDIYCEKLTTPDGFTTTTEKWFVQCKRYRKGIPFGEISSSIDWANDDRATHFTVMSNSYLTIDCREQIKKRAEKYKITFIDWTDKNFQKLLFRRPHILSSYFPDEEIPGVEKKIRPHTIFEFELGVPHEFKDEFMNLMKLDEEERDERIFKLIKNKILKSSKIDANIKSLIYQHFSVISYYKGDIDEAISDLDEALDITPKNRIVLLNKGFMLTEMKKYGDAVNCYHKVLEIEPNDKLALNNIGHCFAERNKYSFAMNYFDKAIEIDPNLILARDNKGGLLQKQYKYKEALSVFDETLKLFPNSKTTLNKKANLLKDMKDFAEAYKIINKALKIDPNFIEALNNKGVILERNGNYGSGKYGKEYKEKYNKMALEIFENVIKLDSNYTLGHTNRIVCLNNLGRFKEALEYSDEVVKRSPDNAIAWNKKGIVFRNLTRFDKAIDCVKKSLEINPNLRESLLDEASIYILTGKFKKALRVAKEMVKRYDKDDDAWGLKGDAWRGIGREDKAEKCYKKAEGFVIPVKSLIE